MEGSATDFTLARISTPFQQWIVYNENANMSLFGRMDTSGLANVFVKTDPQIHVKDMELSGGILYFCGNMSDNSAKGEVGVMGFFKIADLSSPSTMQISYIKFKEFKELRKLTYYATSLTKHVPMVGTGADGRDYIVDVFYGGIEPSMNYWRREWMYIPNIDAEFDDIAGIEKGGRCSVYYTDPQRPDQKGACEKAHVELRKVIGKGASIDGLELEAWLVAGICSHVNSSMRLSIGDASPMALAKAALPASLLEGLGLELIPPDEVETRPELIGRLKQERDDNKQR
jgi:hypothetical protein